MAWTSLDTSLIALCVHGHPCRKVASRQLTSETLSGFVMRKELSFKAGRADVLEAAVISQGADGAAGTRL